MNLSKTGKPALILITFKKVNSTFIGMDLKERLESVI